MYEEKYDNLIVVEAEQSVLGSILIDGDSIKKASGYLKPDHFYSEANRTIYKTLLTLYKEKKDIDLVTVKGHLKSTNKLKNIGGKNYLGELINIVPTSAHIKQYAQQVVDAAIKRGLYKTYNEGIADLFDGKKTLDKIIKATKTSIERVIQQPLIDKPIKTSELLKDYYQTLGYGETNLIGIETGLTKLDKATLGLNGVIVLGGIAGKGKTSLALQIAYNTCTRDIPALFYSLEMPKRAIYTKILNRLSEVKYSDILLKGRPYLSEETKDKNLLGEDNDTKPLFSKGEIERLNKAKEEINKTGQRLYVIDKTDGEVTTDKLERQINLIKEESNTQQLLVVVDHLQIIPLEEYNDLKDKIDRLLAEFKGISERTGATILLISQKNRAGYYSTGLEALMGSASIEYTADIVMFLDSKEEKEARAKQKKQEDDFDEFAQEVNNNAPQDIDLIIVKNRYNPPKTIKLIFNGELSTFTEK